MKKALRNASQREFWIRNGFIRVSFLTTLKNFFLPVGRMAIGFEKIFKSGRKSLLNELHSLSKTRVYQTLKKSFLHFAFPTKCLHCQTLLPPGPLVLCSTCSFLLEILDPQKHCPACFNLLKEETVFICYDCLQNPSLFCRMGAVFNYEGPAETLVKHLKYLNRPYLASGMAAFLVTQLDRLGWPMPDALIPVPLSFTHWLERGYNQSALLAEEMGRFLQCPVWHPLKRQSGDYRQAALTLEQRKNLDHHRFYLNPKYSLKGKVLLVIDDVMTSGSTLRCCAEILNTAQPASLYALTFCRTLFEKE